MKYFLACVILAFAPAVRSEAGPAVRVACVGDSITAGYGLREPQRDAYPAQLARLLGGGWEVRNFGVSGTTMMESGDMPYERQPACAAALGWKPDVVIIALGTNDTKASNIARHPGDFVPSYEAAIARFRAENPRVRIFACLPPPAFPAAMGIREDVLSRRILPRIRRVAAEEKIPLVDLHRPLEADAARFPDRIHPDPEEAARIAEIVYGDLMTATQPFAKATDPAVNTAVIPVPRLEQDSYNWWRRHAEELDLGPKLDPDIVLIGDSITHFWYGPPLATRQGGPRAWAKTFGDRRVLNLGFGWDRTENVLWRLDHGELDGLRPRLVVLNIGTNNFSQTRNSRANSPEEVAAGIRAICDQVQRRCPGARLVVMGVFPRGRSPRGRYRPVIAKLNGILAQELSGRPNTTFLDIGARFLQPDGSISPAIMPDALHPSDRGYAIWGRALVKAGLLP